MQSAERCLDMLCTEIVLAQGCTEPAAVALCAAASGALLPDKVVRVSVNVSPYIYKNGMNVGIPGARGMTGLPIAAALGAVSRTPSLELRVFSALEEAQVEEALQMVREGRVHVAVAHATEKVFIEAICQSDTHTARCIALRSHTHIALLELDGEVIRRETPALNLHAEESGERMTLREIYDFCCTVPEEALYPLRDVERINLEIAHEGMTGEYGLRIGKSLQNQDKAGLLRSDVARQAVAITAAAVDARMAGCELPVMSTAGSGNQGLTASLPIIAAARQMGIDEGKMLRALAFSQLVTIHIKSYMGRLSVLCGCGIAAAIGVCAGLIHMLDGDYEAIATGIRTMAADITGMVCDGAKPGCAIKIATSVQAAFQAASLALNGTGANEMDGIVCLDIENTLRNIGLLCNEGMRGANDMILRMMSEKGKQ